MLLLKKSAVDLALKRLYLANKMVIVLFCSSGLRGQFAAQVICLVPQFFVRLLGLPVCSAYLVL